MTIVYTWRGDVTNAELNALHAEAFETRVFDDTEWNWEEQLHGHSLGWVVARRHDRLVGFVNVPWDGLVHAWIQDTMVAADARHQGIGTELVAVAVREARALGLRMAPRGLRGSAEALLLRRVRLHADERGTHQALEVSAMHPNEALLRREYEARAAQVKR